MSNVRKMQDNSQLSSRRNHIKHLLEIEIYRFQGCGRERGSLAKAGVHSLLIEIELFATDLRGYALQIVEKGKVNIPERVISHLQKRGIFEIAEVDAWYLSPNTNYPKVKLYLETLNYIRLLLIEYLNLQMFAMNHDE